MKESCSVGPSGFPTIVCVEMSLARLAQQLEDCLVDGDVLGVRWDEAIESEVDNGMPLADELGPLPPFLRDHRLQCRICQASWAERKRLCYLDERLSTRRLAALRLRHDLLTRGLDPASVRRYQGLLDRLEEGPSNFQRHFEKCSTCQEVSPEGVGLCHLGEKLAAGHDLVYRRS